MCVCVCEREREREPGAERGGGNGRVEGDLDGGGGQGEHGERHKPWQRREGGSEYRIRDMNSSTTTALSPFINDVVKEDATIFQPNFSRERERESSKYVM